MGLRTSRLPSLLIGLCLVGLLAGCATPPPASDPEALAEYRENNDPLEPTNRVIYEVNDTIDSAVFVPLARGYRDAVPASVREGLHHVLLNIGSVPLLANDLLEGHISGAGDTAARLVINTTIGLGGLIDVAQIWGIPRHDADLGITLALWGADPGPFLFLPLLGPSNVRDAFGFAGDIGLDPTTYFSGPNWLLFDYSRFGVNALDARERHLDDLAEIKKTALDPYATLRSLYNQNRAQQITQARDANRVGTAP